MKKAKKEFILTCQMCQALFVVNVKYLSLKRKFCNQTCAYKYNGQKSRTGEIKKCLNCDSDIYVQKYQITKYYCSTKCRAQYTSCQARVDTQCENGFCSNIFNKTKKSRKRFCGLKCLNIYRSQLASKMNIFKNTKPESQFKQILDDIGITYVFQKPIPWKHGWKKWYDFYIPDFNLLIEIDGIYWHGKNLIYDHLNTQQIQTRDNDILKNKLAINKGFNLERIWEDDITLQNTINLLKKYESKN